MGFVGGDDADPAVLVAGAIVAKLYEKDGRKYLAVKQETYDDLWSAIDGMPKGGGFSLMTLGGIAIVPDSEHFRKWVIEPTKPGHHECSMEGEGYF